MPGKSTWDRLVEFRHVVHRHPEVAGEEEKTAALVRNMIEESHPDSIVEHIGGHGLAAVFDSGREGPSVLFRCELDGLPIRESSSVPYRSMEEGKGHLCGHDGHMAIMLALAAMIAEDRPVTGRAILLFQPAEETGEGAARVIDDPAFSEIVPDYVYSLHNLPGYPMNQVLLSEKVFSAASVGMEIGLKGKSSHAAEPENGINPDKAIARIIEVFNALSNSNDDDPGRFTLVTIIQVALGSKAFGTSPGDAVVRATLRAYLDGELDELKRKASIEARKIALEENLEVSISFTEYFPSTSTDPDCLDLFREFLDGKKMDYALLEKPFRWSEDFGHFTARYKGLMFGLGSGTRQPKLHNPDYDFPDELIRGGAEIFYGLYEAHLIKKERQ